MPFKQIGATAHGVGVYVFKVFRNTTPASYLRDDYVGVSAWTARSTVPERLRARVRNFVPPSHFAAVLLSKRGNISSE